MWLFWGPLEQLATELGGYFWSPKRCFCQKHLVVIVGLHVTQLWLYYIFDFVLSSCVIQQCWSHQYFNRTRNKDATTQKSLQSWVMSWATGSLVTLSRISSSVRWQILSIEHYYPEHRNFLLMSSPKQSHKLDDHWWNADVDMFCSYSDNICWLCSLCRWIPSCASPCLLFWLDARSSL